MQLGHFSKQLKYNTQHPFLGSELKKLMYGFFQCTARISAASECKVVGFDLV
jgi:hypothetical protein